jgi:tRNA uridine 5-carboxymethylaminomethyl modification enzyme
MRSYRVIVIGGGHAGVEAAWAAANLLGVERGGGGAGSRVGGGSGSRATVALVTIDPSKIGVMSCNPAIGGLAKGQLVREVDALGGLMGLATDATGIQFKVLNTSKGQAVHGPRAQCDKHAYAETVRAMIASRPEIDVIAGTVERLVVERGRVGGVVVSAKGLKGQRAKWLNQDGAGGGVGSGGGVAREGDRTAGGLACEADASDLLELSAPAVVLTTGTFMRGLMHTGEKRTQGGRFGEAPAVGISAALRELGFELGRLKTGTPPRLKRDTIEWDALPPALGDATPTAFSEVSGGSAFGIPHSAFGAEARRAAGDDDASALLAACPSLSRFPVLPQVDCRQTRTTPETHALIRANLHRAPMFSGQIESVGPRYCPSIEDKVVRFAEREEHGVFLEPESLRDDWVYCNGISTSLPADVQDAIVRAMPGCARAHVYRYGYAVEYDMVRPHQILPTGMTRLVEGLFLAGQINGTSGYEEAAAQGLVAGVNAALWASAGASTRREWVLGRDRAYIGVLMDDLVTKTPVEPYRMFTSRAEHRLLLRADNAPDRLTPEAEEIGLLSGAAEGDGAGAPMLGAELQRLRREAFVRRRRQIAALERAIARAKVDGVPVARLLVSQGFELEHLRAALAGDAALREDAGGEVAPAVWSTVYAERRYEPYLVRQRAEVRRQAELEHRRIPDGVDYASMANMRSEARAALARFRPRTFGQALRLEGVTPADLTLLSVLVARR